MHTYLAADKPEVVDGREVPVVVFVEVENDKDWADFHPASDDEINRYEAYWAEKCPSCGLERGDHCEHQEVGEF